MSKCLRVWFVNPYALPPDEAGTTRHYGLSSYLIQRGHQALVIASPVHYLTRRRLAGRSGIQAIQGVPFAWIDAPTYRDNGLSRLRNSLVFTLRLLRLPLAQMPFLPDVIVGSSPHPFGAWAAERIARRLRVPFLFEIRDLWPQSLIDLRTVSPHHPVVPVLRSLERTLCHRAQRVIVLPSRVGEYLKRYGVAPSKVVWLPNFIKLDLAPPPTPPPSSEVFEVMYTGTIGVANGVEFLIEAFALLEGTGSKVRLRVVGDGIQREALQQEVQRLGLRSVLFTPPVSKAELLTQMVHAHAFGFVSKEAALFQWGMSPNKLYDYMALARPVIFAGHIPDNPVESAGCGIITKVESASIAGAVQEIAAMTIEERYAMGLRGRCYVEQHYSDTVVGQRLEQLLAEVASCPSTQVNLSVTGGSE